MDPRDHRQCHTLKTEQERHVLSPAVAGPAGARSLGELAQLCLGEATLILYSSVPRPGLGLISQLGHPSLQNQVFSISGRRDRKFHFPLRHKRSHDFAIWGAHWLYLQLIGNQEKMCKYLPRSDCPKSGILTNLRNEENKNTRDQGFR